MLKRVGCVALLLAGVVIGASDPDTAVRHEFMQAYAVAASGQPVADSAALQTYLLYPYLQAARLQAALARPDRDVAKVDATIKSLLQTQASSFAVRELRRLWLLSLASRQQWDEFEANYPANSGDVELRCLHATALLRGEVSAENIALLSSFIAPLWLSANRLSAACNVPFAWARDRQIVTSSMVEQRARLALQAGNSSLARDLAEPLPATQREPLLQWAMLIEKPQQGIDALLNNPRLVVEPAALQDGWQRLARKDQDAALTRWPRLLRARGLDEAAASPYALSLALALSWSRRPEALSFFARVQPTQMNEQALEWQARAALWAMDWTGLRKFILAMPEPLRNQARWRYWLARTTQQLSDATTARALYTALVADEDNYYAALAAARLQQRYAPHAQALPADAPLLQRLGDLPGLRRAHELLLVQLRDEAALEWNATFATLQPGEHITAVRLAHEWQWYDQAISSSAKLGQYRDYAFLYPHPFDPEVAAAVKVSGLSADLIYGVMRQETLFRADARSVANARGLLQLLPETARRTARKANLPIPSADELFTAQINVPLGALYLKAMLDACSGRVALALASYNAGPAATRRWLPAAAMDADIWIENIPFNETRSYVQRVLWHSLVFQWLREQQPVDTEGWLTTISPQALSAGAI